MRKRIIATILAVVTLVLPSSAWARVRQFDQGEFLPEHITEGGYDAGYDPNYDCNEMDTQDVKYYIDEYFTYTAKSDVWFEDRAVPSGWDVRYDAGGISGGYYVPFVLKDEKNNLPTEASRKFEDAKKGEFLLDFTAKFSALMNGATFRIYGDRDIALSLEIKNGYWSLLKADGSYITLSQAKANAEYGVRAVFDVAARQIKKIYINGKLFNVNVPFAGAANKVNSFAINTGAEAIGEITIKTVQLCRGYRIYDRFLGYADGMPEDYVVRKGSAKLAAVAENSFPDQYSLSLNNGTLVERTFDSISGKYEYGFHVIIPNATDKTEIGLKSGNQNIISFYSENGNFGYKTQSSQNTVYKFRPNVWYYLRFIVDSNAKTADMYLNNRLVAESVSIGDTGAANIFSIEASAVGNVLRIDDLYVQPFVPEPENYVPEPQPVSAGEYHIGMQFCPMWVNGHHVGWDSISYDKERLPYIGYYDENSPESIDWIIKQMVEHGMDFARIAWCMQPDNSNPVNKPFFGYSFINALQQAKYKDMIDYMVIWESVTMGSSAEILVNSVGPYWIEHYLKDENYLRIDGRPVISFYQPSAYINGSGTVEAAAEGIRRFREMCIEAGVGNPILTSSTWSENDIAVGFDGISPYFASTGEPTSGLKNGLRYNGVTNFMTPVSMGFDATVWKASVTGWFTPKTFKEAMEYAHDVYMPSISENNIFKNYFLLETYDEFGEGHYPAPAGLYGFSYFDAVREAFTDGGEHTDIVPTMAQKDRFNNLYPYGRDIGQMDKPVKPVTAPKDMEAVASWKFGNGSMAGWTYQGVEGISASGSYLDFTPTTDPQLVLYGVNLELKATPYVKIRAHYEDTNNSYLQVFYTTKEHTGFTESKAAVYTLDPEFTEEGMHDIYVDMSNFSTWTGTLDKFRVDPISSGKGKIQIESIEILYDPEMAKAIAEEEASKPAEYDCNLLGAVHKFKDAPYERGYRKYASARDLAEVLNWTIDYDYYNNSTNIIIEDKIYRLDFSTGKVYDGAGGAISALNNTFIDLDGVTYVDSKFAEVVSNAPFSFVSEEGGTNETLTVTDTSLLWDFHNNEGKAAWVPSTSFGNVYLSNSWMISTITGYYPMLQTKLPEAISADKIKGIAIKLLNETESKKAILRFSGKDGEWYQNYAFEFALKPNDLDSTEYYIETSGDIVKFASVADNADAFFDTNANVNFKGLISNLRFEFEDSPGAMAIDYIRIDLKESTEEGY